MRERWQSPLPIIYVQMHLQGGPRRFLVIALGYLAVCLFVLISYRRIAFTEPLRVIAAHGMRTLAFAQGVIAVLVGANMVHRALARDHQTHMIESHRLSPMSNIAVVFGFIFGGPLRALMLFGLNVAIGLVLASIAVIPLKDWVLGNILVLNGAMMAWALTVFCGVGAGKPVSPIGPLIGLMFTGQIIFLALPGAALLLGVYSTGMGIHIMMGSSSPGTDAMLLITTANMGFTLYWLNAACARYRRPELPALNAVRGTVLLLMWLLASTLGIVVYEKVSQMRGFSFLSDDMTGKVHWLLSLAISLLLMLLPLRATAVLRGLQARGTGVRDWSDKIPGWALAVVLPVVVCAISLTIGKPIWVPLVESALPRRWTGLTFDEAARITWLHTTLAILFASVTYMSLARAAAGRSKVGRYLCGLAVWALWAGPVVMDFARAAYEAIDFEVLHLSPLFGASPFGTLILIWNGEPISTVPGLITQGAAATVALMVSLIWARRPTNPTRDTHVAPIAA